MAIWSAHGPGGSSRIGVAKYLETEGSGLQTIWRPNVCADPDGFIDDEMDAVQRWSLTRGSSDAPSSTSERRQRADLTHTPTETFEIDAGFARSWRITSWGIALFTVFIAAAPLFPEPWGFNSRTETYVVIVLGVLIFGSVAVWMYRSLKSIPFLAVTVDNDGLWLARTSKERGLVPWRSIRAVKERHVMHGIELLDDHGESLIGLPYQLSGFDRLVALALERMPREHMRPLLPATFSKPRAYHVLMVAGIVCITALFCLWYVADDPIMYGLTVVAVGFLLRKYLTTVFKLVVTSDGLEISYPLVTRRLLPSEVDAVKIDTGVYQSEGRGRSPDVRLFIIGTRKPIRLAGLGCNAYHLYQALSQVVGKGASAL